MDQTDAFSAFADLLARDDEEIEIRREVIRTSITVLDLVTGELEVVAQLDPVCAQQAGRAA